MRFVLKKLSESDLTLFRSKFRLRNTAKQKGINFNMNPVNTVVYPGIRDVVERAGRGGLRITLKIAGPGGAPFMDPLTRKIVKSAGGKNLRLNGELVGSPDSDPERFGELEKGDIALFGFEGEPLPHTVHLVLATSRHGADKKLVENAYSIIGDADRYMEVLGPSERESLLETVNHDHPAFVLCGPEPGVDDLIEIVQGNAEVEERIRLRRVTRPLTAEDLASARQRVASIGEAGETLVNEHLAREHIGGAIRAFSWTSRTNAIAPFDFEITRSDGTVELVDVKSTVNDFHNPLHLSAGELRTCASEDRPYRLFRVWDLDNAPKLRRSEDIREWARGVVRAVAGLPKGVVPDSFTVSPDVVEWTDEEIELPIEGDDI